MAADITIFVTIQLHPIFVRFVLFTYREYASEVKTNENGAHLNSYGYEFRVICCLC